MNYTKEEQIARARLIRFKWCGVDTWDNIQRRYQIRWMELAGISLDVEADTRQRERDRCLKVIKAKKAITQRALTDKDGLDQRTKLALCMFDDAIDAVEGGVAYKK